MKCQYILFQLFHYYPAVLAGLLDWSAGLGPPGLQHNKLMEFIKLLNP